MAGASVPLLRTADEVADWLDASHPLDRNFAAFARMDDAADATIDAVRLWADGAHLAVARRHPGARP